MIYLSTSTYCDIGLEKGIIKLSRSGFNNLELSGGPIIEPSDFIKIKKLKNELNINFRLHNYFPVPKKEFVINFAPNLSNGFETLIKSLLDKLLSPFNFKLFLQ